MVERYMAPSKDENKKNQESLLDSEKKNSNIFSHFMVSPRIFGESEVNNRGTAEIPVIV